MKNFKYINLSITSLLGLSLILFSSCERDPSDDAVPATFNNLAEVFTDNPVNLTDDFFKSFDPAVGANVNGFGVDENESAEGTTSIRIEVPSPNDPDGGFIGGIFRDRGVGRDLTGYTALTFWARASIPVSGAEFGFGTDFLDGQYPVSGLFSLTTGWKQYTLAMPNPSVYTQELGMFLFSLGTQSTGGIGYTVWLDEIRFENLQTIAQPRPSILGGEDLTQEVFIGSAFSLEPLTQTYNLGDGSDQTVNAAASFFEFKTSNSGVASIDEEGTVTILSEGTATITAFLAGVKASGSVTVDVVGTFDGAPTPTQPAEDVISIFSDFYGERPGLNIATFNGPATQIAVPNFGGDAVLSYNNLDFVGIGWTETADVSGLTHLHLDVQVDQSIAAGQTFRVVIQDFGANGIGEPLGGSDDTAGAFDISGTADLIEGQWVGIDIPVNGFTLGTGGGGAGSPNLTRIGNVVFVGSFGISNVLVDNIYFYK